MGAGSAAVRRSSNAGTSRSVRFTPQTSVMTETSNARMPGKETRAIRDGARAGAGVAVVSGGVAMLAVKHRSMAF